MGSSIIVSERDYCYRLKEVSVKKLKGYLRTLKKMVKTKPIISPVYLIYKDSGIPHQASFWEHDWEITFGNKKDFKIGYYRKQYGSKPAIYFEEYNEGEIPYRILVPKDQPLPESKSKKRKR